MKSNKVKRNIMAKERFTLASGKDLMWTVKDNESGIAIEFREGLFNESRRLNSLSTSFLPMSLEWHVSCER